MRGRSRAASNSELRHWLAHTSAPPIGNSDYDQTVLDSWWEADRPFVVRRGSTRSLLAVGMCVPSANSGAKPRRIGAIIERTHVAELSPPPLLTQVATTARVVRSPDSAALNVISAQLAPLRARVYGSWMWWWLANADERMVRQGSDLDLVIAVRDRSEAQRACTRLHKASQAVGMHIDAELSIPVGNGQVQVHWREYLGAGLTVGRPQGDVLAKSATGVDLVGSDTLWL